MLGTWMMMIAVVAAGDGAPGPLALDALPDDDALAALVWERSPDLAPARARVAAARADLTRAEALPNPQLDLAWNTIPLGQTNPPGLAHPLSQVPNYSATLSELIEIGKRGPRQRSARFASEAVLLDAWSLLTQRHLALLESIGRIAAGQARLAALSDVAADAAALTQVQRARAERGDIADLDVGRALLEEQKLQASLADARQKLASALVECAAIAAVRCEPFSTAEKAHGFLEARSTVPAGDLAGLIADRPDLRALEAQGRSSRAAEELGRAKALPDVTLRVGFTYDQFVTAGNQEKSLAVGASIPLPLFERGQGDVAQAAAAARAAELGRERLLEQARRELPVLLDQLADVRRRRAAMREQIVPLARSVVDRLDGVVRAGGASLQDVLLARRTLGEVLLDAVDLDVTALQLALQVRRVSAAAPRLPSRSAGPLP